MGGIFVPIAPKNYLIYAQAVGKPSAWDYTNVQTVELF